MNVYWKNVSSVLFGSVIAQMIPLLGSLFIARIYSPADFGMFSTWLGIVMLLAVLLTCRYEMALAIEKDGDRHIAVAATLAVTFVLTIFSLFILVGVFSIERSFFSKYSDILVFTALPSAFFLAVINTWQMWAAAEGMYRILSFMRITQTALITFLQVSVGYLSPSAESLAFIQLIGMFLTLCLSAYMLPLKCNLDTLLKSALEFFSRQRRLPFFSLPADFINTASAQLPLLIVASRFGVEIAGYLALTMKVLGAPMGVLGKAVLDVFRRHAADSYRIRGECRREYMSTFKMLTLASFLVCIFMFFFGEQLFAALFGPEWGEAGIMAIWLLPLFAMRFIASPLSYMVYIAEKQHLDLFWQCGLLITTLLCLCVSSEYREALISYSLAYSFLYFIYLIISYRSSLGARV